MTFLGGFKGKGWKQDLNFFRKFSATARYYRVLADVETKTEAILSPFNIWEKLRKTVFVFHENRWSFVAKKATKKAQILTKNGLKVYGFALLSCDVMRRRPFVCEYLSCTKLGQEPFLEFANVQHCSTVCSLRCVGVRWRKVFVVVFGFVCQSHVILKSWDLVSLWGSFMFFLKVSL